MAAVGGGGGGGAMQWDDAGTTRTVSETYPAPIQGSLDLLDNEGHIGEVGFWATLLKLTPTVSNGTAYAAGDAVGGKLTLTNAARATSGSARLKSLTLVDKDNQKAAYTLLLFDADFTHPGDNAAWAWAAADYAKLAAAVSVQASDWVTLGGDAVATIPLADLLVVANGTANLYGALVTSGTPTFASTTSLLLHVGLEGN